MDALDLERQKIYWFDLLENLLVAREEVYPLRDKTYLNLNSAIDDFTHWLINQCTYSLSNEDRIRAGKINELTWSPVFVSGTMKSGTSMMIQLLDGHNNLIVMPGDSHYMNNRMRLSPSNYESIALYWMRRLINPTGQRPFWFLGKEIMQYKRFVDFLMFFITPSLPHTQSGDIFVCVVKAVTATIKNKEAITQLRYWVEKTPNNEMFFDELTCLHSAAKFIHIVRDPLVNVSSLKKLARYRGYRFSSLRTIYYINQSLSRAELNMKKKRDCYFLLRYEDVVHDPKVEMQKVVDFLNIKFSDRLLIPTENSVPAKANSMYKENRIEGKIVDQSKNLRWKTELTRLEKTVVINGCMEKARRYGYIWEKNVDIKRYTNFLIQLGITIIQYPVDVVKKLKKIFNTGFTKKS